MVYRPSQDTFLMLECLDDLDLEEKKVLDMGTGNGELAVAAAEGGAEVVAVDVDPEAVQYTKDKVISEDLSQQVKVRYSDLFSDIDESFDIIIFNPPYVPSSKKKYIDLDGGSDGNEVVHRFLEQVESYLKDEGFVLVLTSTLGKEDLDTTLEVEEYREKNLWFEDLKVWKCIV